MLACSLYEFPEMADEQISYFLTQDYNFYQEAFVDNPVFAEAVGSLEERHLPLESVGVLVGGLTGITPDEQEAFAVNGFSQLKGVVMPLVRRVDEKRNAHAVEKLGYLQRI